MLTIRSRKTAIGVLGLLCWLGTAYSAVAAVRINEIAWMGTAESPANEWIELYNDAVLPVSLSGWKIVAGDGSPAINLSGVIVAKGYFLIERTDDNSVPGVTADLIASFGAGLSNSGETLLIKDASSTVADTVVGGFNWASIGGDNATKETAQYTSRGWQTGVPTPRRENIQPRDHAHAVATNPTLPVDAKMTTQTSQLIKVASLDAKATATKAAPQSRVTAIKTPTTTVLWKGNEASAGASGFLAGRNAEWFFLSVGVALSLLAGFIIVRSGRKEISSADEYAIVEDIIESVDD